MRTRQANFPHFEDVNDDIFGDDGRGRLEQGHYEVLSGGQSAEHSAEADQNDRRGEVGREHPEILLLKCMERPRTELFALS